MNPAIGAIVRRDLVRYFTNPTAYVFITFFILLSAGAQFWLEEFFGSNLANLAPLNHWFPVILLFFIPAVAMGTWADERRHGTDELLLTLPASDGAIIFGKYLSALSIYTVSLFFALSHIVVLSFLGHPDLGLMFGTYLGYWLLGASLLSIAIIGSMLSDNVTVAFILGSIFCGIPVGLGMIGRVFSNVFSTAGAVQPFEDFTSGVFSLKGLVYFLALTAFGLACNYYLLRRRRLSAAKWHLPVRAASLGVAAAAICILSGRTEARLDVTQERLHSLSKETREMFASLSADKPVYIQAFISTEVPREYVQTRENLLSMLREYSVLGRGKLLVKVYEVLHNSEAAVEAEEKYRIMPMGRSYLGLVFTCGIDEVVIPFLFKGLSAEYELTRSIRTVTKAKRLKIGVMNTDAKWVGGFDMQTFAQIPPWPIIEELKKQYEVVTVMPPDAELKEVLDALVVPQTSSLTQPQADNLLAYVKKGTPTLFLDDPLPIARTDCAPAEQKKRPGGGGFGGGGGPAEEKCNIRGFYQQLGILWESHEIVWDRTNPHPELGNLPPEIVFVGASSGAPQAFSAASPITAGLQEVVLLFPGRVRSANVNGLNFVPLLHAGRNTGMIAYSDVWTRNWFGQGTINPNRRYLPQPMDYVLAARVGGSIPGAKPEDPETKVQVAFVADIDLISEQFFEIRREAVGRLDFDNVTFVLNCIDALAGDNDFIELRKRRPRHRTLEAIEEKTRLHDQKQLQQNSQAEEEARQALVDAQASFDKKVKEIESRTDLDDMSKARMVEQVREQENRQLEVQKQNIENEKRRKIARSETSRDQQVRRIRNLIRGQAMLFPVLPPLLIGLYVFIRRVMRELEARR